jgi:broad specificity phosphatase PhoE
VSEAPVRPLTATLVLVRHGESTWNARGRFQGRRNPWLSERGRAEAVALAKRLADPLESPPLPVPSGQPLAIWHSPLRRASDTAHAIGDLVPVDLVADDRLSEISQGEWETQSHRSVAALGPALEGWRADPTKTTAPGGESLSAVRRRVRAALDDILSALGAAGSSSGPAAASQAAQPWGIVVSHDGALRIGTLLLLGLPLARFWAFPFEPAAITVVELSNGQPILRAHNLTSHLAKSDGFGSSDRGGAL